jgi:catechol 2,3-dioxygenase-like lactoylglutathione lyase family enzyme
LHIKIEFMVRICFVVLILISFQGYSQSTVNNENEKLIPYLTGIMANDASKLQQWYTKHLGFVIKDEKNIPQQKMHFFLLEHDGYLLEIIQRSDLYDAQKVLDTAKTVKYVRGFFKVGFKVTNIKERYAKLKNDGVTIVSENVSKNEDGDFILLKDPEENLVQLFRKQ